VTANVVAPGFVDTPMTRALFPTDEEMKIRQRIRLSPIRWVGLFALKSSPMRSGSYRCPTVGDHRPDASCQQRGLDDLITPAS